MSSNVIQNTICEVLIGVYDLELLETFKSHRLTCKALLDIFSQFHI